MITTARFRLKPHTTILTNKHGRFRPDVIHRMVEKVLSVAERRLAILANELVVNSRIDHSAHSELVDAGVTIAVSHMVP